MLWPGAYQDRDEAENFQWYAAFYLFFASETIVEDNVVAGKIIMTTASGILASI